MVLRNTTKILGILLLVILLTALTQVGGLILLLFLLIWRKALQKFERLKSARRIYKFSFKLGFFTIFYTLICLFIVPIFARPFGRVPLPINHDKVQPLNILTCLLNRHYVKEELLNTAISVAEDLNTAYPGTILAYLDAGFPFIDEFPLLPHLSHDDGEKLDLAFLYKDAESGEALNDAAPSFIGYGVFENPLPHEQDQPIYCEKKGYWQYSILGALVPQWNKSYYEFDEVRTKALIVILTKEAAIQKIFIEPHLKTRMNLHSNKIRYHGCGAVRHDDHIHIQL